MVPTEGVDTTEFPPDHAQKTVYTVSRICSPKSHTLQYLPFLVFSHPLLPATDLRRPGLV